MEHGARTRDAVEVSRFKSGTRSISADLVSIDSGSCSQNARYTRLCLCEEELDGKALEMKKIASTSDAGLKIYAVDSMGELRPVSHSKVAGALCVSWNHTNNVLAVGGTDDSIQLVQADGESLTSIPFDEEDAFKGPVRCLAFSGNSRYLVSSAGSTINLWDLKRRQLKATFGSHRAEVTCLSTSSEGDVVSGDASGAVRIWDIKSGSSSAEIVRDERLEACVECIVVSSTGPPRIAIGYSDGFVDVRNYHTLQSMWRTFHAERECRVTDISFSAKNPSLLNTSGADGRVNLFDTSSSTFEHTEPRLGSINLGSANYPTAISQEDDGTHIVVGNCNGDILYYDWRNTSEPFFEVPDGEDHHHLVTAICFERPVKAASAPSTPKRPKRLGSGGVKSPLRSGGKVKEGREPLSAMQTSTGSLGSTMSSLSASTGQVAGVGTQMQIQAQLQRPKTMLERVETVRETLYTDDRPLSEASTPPRSPPRPGAALSSRSTTGAEVIASRQQGLQESRDILSSVSAQVEGIQRERARDTDRASASASVLDEGEEEESGVSVPTRETSMTLPPPPNSPPERASEVGAMNDSVSVSVSGTEADGQSEAGRDSRFTAGSSRYSKAYVDSLISARLSHRDRDRHTSEVPAGVSTDRGGPEGGKTQTPSQEPAKDDKLEQLRQGVSSVTSQELQEALQVLKYDIHKDVWSILSEQSRQFELQRGDMMRMVEELKGHLSSVLEANTELRRENERLRHIY